MSFYRRLIDATRHEQEALLEIPFVARALRGEISHAGYRGFLEQAYHHVKHTVPLLMATGARTSVTRPWMGRAICEYIDEEQGHEEWVLSDLAAAGGDAAATRSGVPDLPCELLVAYVYDQVQRVSPLCFFGMVHVLEGTSVRAASQAAERIQSNLGLPPQAFTYLTSHGALDQEHTRFFGDLMDRVEDERDQAHVLHSAHVCFRLYGDVFRNLAA